MPTMVKAYRAERKQKVVKQAVVNPYTGQIVAPEEKEEYGPYEVVVYDMYVGDAREAVARFSEYFLKEKDAQAYADDLNRKGDAEMKKAAAESAKLQAQQDAEAKAQEAKAAKDVQKAGAAHHDKKT